MPLAQFKAPEMELPVLYETLTTWQKRHVRELYVKRQKGRCMYCEEALHTEPPKRITDIEVNEDLFPGGFFDHPIHLQHSHESGLTEGAVHAYCNAILWQYHGR